MARKKKVTRCDTYQKRFNEIVEKKITVKGKKYREYVEEIIENADDYRQCYKKGFKVREELPRYWFVSKKGFLISIDNANNPKFVKPSESKRPQFRISKSGKDEFIPTYALVGLVWDSYIEPDAYKILDKPGAVRKIGRYEIDKKHNKHKIKIQAHHTNPEGYLKDNSLESYIINNDPLQIQIITCKTHNMLTNISDNQKKSVAIINDKNFSEIPDNTVKIMQYAEINKTTNEVINSRKLIEHPEKYQYEVVGIHVEYAPEDCFVTDGIRFISKGNAEFLKAHKGLLLDIVQSDKVKKGYFEFENKSIWYERYEG